MILHIDMDCFFVSAERTQNASLKGKPMVVANRSDTAIFNGKTGAVVAGGRGAFSGSTVYNKFSASNDWRDHFLDGDRVRGIAVAVSYEARAFGIRTGTTISEALKMCPDLIVYPSNMPLYYELSGKLFELLSTEIPVLEQYSIDEFFGDLSGWVKPSEVGEFVKNLQTRVANELDLPATIGVSSTKLLAKLAAKSAKPFGTKVLMPSEIRSFTKDIPITAVAGIGKQSSRYLQSHGVKTIGDLMSAKGLMESLGKNGREILSELDGVSVKSIEIDSPQKSVGISRTFDPISDRAELKRRLFILARHLTFSVLSQQLDPKEVTLTIKYQIRERHSVRLLFETSFSELKLIDLIDKQFKELDSMPSEAVKYLGISAGNFAKDGANLFEDKRLRSLSKATQAIRKKHGLDLIFVASESLKES